MSKLILFLLLLLLGMGLVSSKFFVAPKPITAPIEIKQEVVTPPVLSTPQVSKTRLFTHLENLQGDRSTNQNRQVARNYITTSLKNLGWSPNLQSFVDGINIVAERSGKIPNAGTIIVAAHYDTVPGSPGADDNATGVATLLEIARIFNNLSTPQTLKLVFFDSEEIGLRGSLAFTANIANLANLNGVVVMDMIGFGCYTPNCQKYPPGLPAIVQRDRGDFLAVVGDAEHLQLLKAFTSTKLPVITLPIPLKGLFTPDVLRSDHAPFWYQGIGAVLVTDTANLRSPHYHQLSDTVANIDRSFFTGAAQVVVNAIHRLLVS
ncbi:M20/M25/M40 family metallo-hydrolase [Synechocystis sp. PCC 7509]|uniref:M20/M25/M40 family metallo-hydrolase n=1 Tax=Synechocystis sp. PCC 7509 TaxID=927677 RepID=UPI0002AC5552|nr:M20/M25/M40 family metallo-hydrolase [Synechocystis sp. PCC 7509]